MFRVAAIAVLLALPAAAQTTTPALFRIPYLTEAPNVAQSVWSTFRGSTYYDATLDCPRWTGDGHTFHPCVADLGHVASAQQAAKDDAVAQSAASLSAATATLNASMQSARDDAAAALASEVTARQSADAACTSATSSLATRVSALESTSATTAAVNYLSGRVDALQASALMTATAQPIFDSMSASISANAASVSSVTTRVASLEANSATTAALTSVQTTLNGRIDGLATRVSALESAAASAQRRSCGSATVTGLSVPLAGISTETAVAVAGAPIGTSCSTGTNSFMPLGARAEAIVTAAGTVRLRFVSNAGLLSSVISIPSGTYRVCCDL